MCFASSVWLAYFCYGMVVYVEYLCLNVPSVSPR